MLVAAVTNQRPELFAATISNVPVTDMLRYQKFTGGKMWSDNYGNSDNQGAADYLLKYSPLHTIKHSLYPSMMILAADHDDRVVPLHTYKFVATL
jgi:prolyl oligopeptidase